MHELGVQNSTKRCLEKLGNNLAALQKRKEQIQSYIDLLEKKESNVDDVLHLIYVKRNPEDHGARIYNTRPAIIKMGERLTLVNSLIDMHVAFIDAVNNDRADIVLYHAVASLSAYLGAISDQDDFWKHTVQAGHGYQLSSILNSYSVALSKAAHAIKCIMDYKVWEEK